MKQPPQFERQDLDKMAPSVLVDIILRQQEAIQQLFEEIERLKAIVNRTSRDSSKPPSSDLLKKSEKAKEQSPEEDKRKAGGQPGHQGKTRKGFGKIDKFEDVVGEQDIEANLQSMLAWLGTYAHMSYEKQQEWLEQMGVEIGTGTLVATTERVAESIKGKVEELANWISEQPHNHVDETMWPIKGVKEWLWSYSGEGYALYKGADTRSRAELEAVLGEHYEGVLSSDDYSVYNGYSTSRQQKCLAHLRRHFKKLLKLSVKSQVKIGELFIKMIDEAFAAYKKWQNTQDSEKYFSWAKKFKEKLEKAITEWMPKVGYAAGLLLRSLKNKSEQWWYFLEDPKVPPDNNRAERNLRLAVTKRKVCGGSRSMDGLENTAALLTVIQTCKAQGKSALEFFRQALIDPSALSLIPEQT